MGICSTFGGGESWPPRFPCNLVTDNHYVTAPTGAPQDVVTTITSRIISVAWSDIDCIERNGAIIGYEVELYRVDGTAIPFGEVVGQTFTIRGLQPSSDHTFRVAGVNTAGRGPFTNIITLHTPEDGVFYV